MTADEYFEWLVMTSIAEQRERKLEENYERDLELENEKNKEV